MSPVDEAVYYGQMDRSVWVRTELVRADDLYSVKHTCEASKQVS